MNADKTELAEAAARLQPEDLRFLEERGMLPEEDTGEDTSTDGKEEESTQTATHEEEEPDEEETSRSDADHRWPEVGAVLEADYKGRHYEAEVISMPRYKSGKAVRILTGPAAGEVERSMSGAMMTATEKQREENDLGRSGVSNGWTFWSVKEEEGHEENG